MVFSQPTFLFAFLPVVLAIHLVAPRWARNASLALVSLVFYAWGEGAYVGLLAGSCVLNYLLGRKVAGAAPGSGASRCWVGLGVALNLGILVLFKYAGWLTSGAVALDLPLGISFFTFQAISFLVDVHRRDAEPPRSFADFALYLSLFPQLVAGPIVRYRDLAAQIRNRSVRSDEFAEGVRRFVFGLAKKVLIADVLNRSVDSIFALGPEALSPAVAWFGCAAYTLQIYFDFSGYSDMAIGIGLMMGFRLPENFRHPYASASITEFWRRWHISLSTWFRDYVYIPLGGNRRGAARTYVNLGLVFLLCGLWHGAAWTFVIWGAYHGLLLVIERLGAGRLLAALPRPVAVGITVLLVAIGWVPFRAVGFHESAAFLGAMAGAEGALSQPLLLHADRHSWTVLVIGAILAMPVCSGALARARRARPVGAALYGAGILALLALCFAGVSGQSHAPFLYFRF